MREFFKFRFVLLLLAEIQKIGQKQEKAYGTINFLQFFADKMRADKHYGNSVLLF